MSMIAKVMVVSCPEGWLVSIPELDIMTQATTVDDVFPATLDIIRSLGGSDGIPLSVVPSPRNGKDIHSMLFGVRMPDALFARLAERRRRHR